MFDSKNPIHAWLMRAALECQTPVKMDTWGCMMQNENTKWLICNFARQWQENLPTGPAVNPLRHLPVSSSANSLVNGTRA